MSAKLLHKLLHASKKPVFARVSGGGIGLLSRGSQVRVLAGAWPETQCLQGFPAFA